jgi:hypothetical protein
MENQLMEKKVVLTAKDIRRLCKKIEDDTELVVKTPKSNKAYVITGISRIFKERKMVVAFHAELEDDE